MKFVHKIFNRKYSNAIARKGIGPLIPSTAISFLSGCCSNCGRLICDYTIFGNALVLEENGILKLKCSDCRFGNKIQINYNQVIRGLINKNLILIDLNERIEKETSTWIEIMIAWYTNYGILQHSHRYDEAYSIKLEDNSMDLLMAGDILYEAFDYIVPIQNTFGNIEALNHCGECGAFWSNKFIKDKIPELLKSGKCFPVGFLTNFNGI